MAEWSMAVVLKTESPNLQNARISAYFPHVTPDRPFERERVPSRPVRPVLTRSLHRRLHTPARRAGRPPSGSQITPKERSHQEYRGLVRFAWVLLVKSACLVAPA